MSPNTHASAPASRRGIGSCDKEAAGHFSFVNIFSPNNGELGETILVKLQLLLLGENEEYCEKRQFIKRPCSHTGLNSNSDYTAATRVSLASSLVSRTLIIPSVTRKTLASIPRALRRVKRDGLNTSLGPNSLRNLTQQRVLPSDPIPPSRSDRSSVLHGNKVSLELLNLFVYSTIYWSHSTHDSRTTVIDLFILHHHPMPDLHDF